MTNAELIAKIKAEIERLKALLPEEKGVSINLDWARNMLVALLSFLSTLESEKPMNQKGLEEEYKDYVENDPVYSKLVNRNAGFGIARHFAEWGYLRAAEKYNEIEYNRQRAEESVQNGLEEAAQQYAEGPECTWVGTTALEYAFIAGAKWDRNRILAIIKSRLSEIIGDAQPKPALRAELEELINKIKK